MDRSVRGELAELDLAELLNPPRKRDVIRNREIQLEQLDKRPKESLGLAKRKMEDHADRQGRLDREVRIGALATGLAAGGSTPGFERVIREPDGQVATMLEAGLIFRPIPYPIPRLGVLVLAALRILHRGRLRGSGLRVSWKPQSGAMHQRRAVMALRRVNHPE